MMNPAGLMTGGLPHQTVVLRGDAGGVHRRRDHRRASRRVEEPDHRPARPVRLPEVNMSAPDAPRGRRRQWGLRAGRRVGPRPRQPRDALRGRRPARRPRRHPRRPGGRPDGRRRHRFHRAQRAHLPDAAAAVRRARHRDAGVRHEHVGARRGDRPRVGRRPRCLRPVPDEVRTSATRATCGCSPRSRASTGWRKKLLASPEVSTLRRSGGPRDHRRDETLAHFLERGRFTDFFVTYFMTPLVSAVWSTDPDHALDYPARYLFRFLEHHGMLTVFGSPTWRTVTDGSREYVERVAKNLHEVRLSSPVSEIREHEHGVDVTDPSGTATYDAVVVATHPDQALAMLAEPTPLHREVLGAIRYQPNIAQLHTDERLLPRAEGARASWNYQRRDDGRVLVTYDMTRLQRLDLDRLDHREAPPRFLVSLGAEDVVDPSTVIATMRYAHPVYTPASVAAQARLPAAEHEPCRLRRRLPRLGLPRGRRALRPQGGRSPRRTLDLGRRAPAAGADPAHLRHRDQARARRAGAQLFSYRSHTWLVDLDDLPRYTGALAPLLRRLAVVRGPRPRRRPRPQPAREHRRLPRGARHRPAGRTHPDARAPAHPRLRLQPDLRVLVPPARPRARGGRGRGAQHLRRATRLPRATRPSTAGRASTRSSTCRRSTTPPAPTTSPSRCPARRSPSASPSTARAAHRSPRR